MSREITSHEVNPANAQIKLTVVDEPGQGGACHEYRAQVGDTVYAINFQNGPIKEAGVNGLTHEVLLAIIADRLESFQSGPYACTANAQALDAVNQAQEALQSRTRERMARGVEGTHEQ